MVNLVTIVVAYAVCVVRGHAAERRRRRFFCHAAADFCIKRRRASLSLEYLYAYCALSKLLTQFGLATSQVRNVVVVITAIIGGYWSALIGHLFQLSSCFR